jgi:hypothetical protein
VLEAGIRPALTTDCERREYTMKSTYAPEIPAETRASTSPTAPKSWRDHVHPAADMFDLMTDAELKELADDIKASGLQHPIVILKDEGRWSILDGRNRLAALERCGALETDANGWPAIKAGAGIRGVDRPRSVDGLTATVGANPTDTDGDGAETDADGDYTDAGWATAIEAWCRNYVLSANVHRRHLTREQKRELIAKVLAADPSKSNREIAQRTKADDKTVASVRREKEGRAEIPHAETRTDSLGRSQPATKPDKANDNVPSAPKAEPTAKPGEDATKLALTPLDIPDAVAEAEAKNAAEAPDAAEKANAEAGAKMEEAKAAEATKPSDGGERPKATVETWARFGLKEFGEAECQRALAAEIAGNKKAAA